jgi:hypothetical protein
MYLPQSVERVDDDCLLFLSARFGGLHFDPAPIIATSLLCILVIIPQAD